MNVLTSISQNAHYYNPTVYAEFYDRYSEAALSHRNQRIVLNRVLHTDETEDRSRHFVLTEYHDSIRPPMLRRFNALGAPEHIVPYQAGNYELAMTDGQRVVQYEVLGVQGLYRAHINGVDQQYDPSNESVTVRCRDNQRQLSHLTFNSRTGDGVMRFVDNEGWILSDMESMHIKTAVLDMAARSLATVLQHAS